MQLMYWSGSYYTIENLPGMEFKQIKIHYSSHSLVHEKKTKSVHILQNQSCILYILYVYVHGLCLYVVVQTFIQILCM